jgi:hypothetical protein
MAGALAAIRQISSSLGDHPKTLEAPAPAKPFLHPEVRLSCSCALAQPLIVCFTVELNPEAEPSDRDHKAEGIYSPGPGSSQLAISSVPQGEWCSYSWLR